MVTVDYKHIFSKNLTWYTDIAATFNGPSAHYDLGAGGRGVTTDCHDTSVNDASGGALANPHCFTGTTLVGEVDRLPIQVLTTDIIAAGPALHALPARRRRINVMDVLKAEEEEIFTFDVPTRRSKIAARDRLRPSLPGRLHARSIRLSGLTTDSVFVSKRLAKGRRAKSALAGTCAPGACTR